MPIFLLHRFDGCDERMALAPVATITQTHIFKNRAKILRSLCQAREFVKAPRDEKHVILLANAVETYRVSTFQKKINPPWGMVVSSACIAQPPNLLTLLFFWTAGAACCCCRLASQEQDRAEHS